MKALDERLAASSRGDEYQPDALTPRRTHRRDDGHSSRSSRYQDADEPLTYYPDSYVVGAKQKIVISADEDVTPTQSRRSHRHHDEGHSSHRSSHHNVDDIMSASRRREGEDEETYRNRRRQEKHLRRQRAE